MCGVAGGDWYEGKGLLLMSVGVTRLWEFAVYGVGDHAGCGVC